MHILFNRKTPLCRHNVSLRLAGLIFGKSKSKIGRIFLRSVSQIKQNFVPSHLGFEIFNGQTISDLYTPEFFRTLFENGNKIAMETHDWDCFAVQSELDKMLKYVPIWQTRSRCDLHLLREVWGFSDSTRNIFMLQTSKFGKILSFYDTRWSFCWYFWSLWFCSKCNRCLRFKFKEN